MVPAPAPAVKSEDEARRNGVPSSADELGGLLNKLPDSDNNYASDATVEKVQMKQNIFSSRGTFDAVNPSV